MHDGPGGHTEPGREEGESSSPCRALVREEAVGLPSGRGGREDGLPSGLGCPREPAREDGLPNGRPKDTGGTGGALGGTGSLREPTPDKVLGENGDSGQEDLLCMRCSCCFFREDGLPAGLTIVVREDGLLDCEEKLPSDAGSHGREKGLLGDASGLGRCIRARGPPLMELSGRDRVGGCPRQEGDSRGRAGGAASQELADLAKEVGPTGLAGGAPAGSCVAECRAEETGLPAWLHCGWLPSALVCVGELPLSEIVPRGVRDTKRPASLRSRLRVEIFR